MIFSSRRGLAARSPVPGRLYRAVDACPSVKAVWLSAFHRPDAFAPEVRRGPLDSVVASVSPQSLLEPPD